LRLSSLSGEQVDNEVTSDAEQPASERASVWVRVVPLDGSGHGAEDFLDKILGIGFLEPSSSRESVHQRSIDLGEFGPGALVTLVAEANEQTGVCARLCIHPVAL
jgi:hypothetical protein